MSLLSKKKKRINVNREEYVISASTPFNVTEAFRNLKASICISLPKKVNGEGAVITFTSPNSCEGKTTVAVNLAMMLAVSNAKVMLIDADIRKGRVAKMLKADTEPGLSGYLSGQVEKGQIIHKYSDKLDFITRGMSSPRPYELLESEAMREFLNELKKEYDYVIIDTPPLPALSDALAVATKSDGTVVVCRHRQSNVNEIAKTLNTLTFASAPILGVVVNDYKAERTNRYGYYYRYYYEKSGK